MIRFRHHRLIDLIRASVCAARKSPICDPERSHFLKSRKCFFRPALPRERLAQEVTGLGEPPDELAPARCGKPHGLAGGVLGGDCLRIGQEQLRLHAQELDVIETETALTGDVQTFVDGELGRLDLPGLLCAAGANQMIQAKMLDGPGVQNPRAADSSDCRVLTASPNSTRRVGPKQLAACPVIFPPDHLVDLFRLGRRARRRRNAQHREASALARSRSRACRTAIEWFDP